MCSNCNVLNGITHTIEKILKEDQNLHYFVVTVVHTVTQKADALKDQDEKAYQDQKNYHFMVT